MIISTFFVGGTIACGALISDLKFEGLLLLTPMIIEFFLKLRGRFKGECYASKMEDGKLFYDGKIESLTHIAMKRSPLTERQLVIRFWLVEGLIAVIVTSVSWMGYI